jgi:hypothetical protein
MNPPIQKKLIKIYRKQKQVLLSYVTQSSMLGAALGTLMLDESLN